MQSNEHKLYIWPQSADIINNRLLYLSIGLKLEFVDFSVRPIATKGVSEEDMKICC